jgi:low affinity Fe/Cu permease
VVELATRRAANAAIIAPGGMMRRTGLTFEQRCQELSTTATKWAGSTAVQLAALSILPAWLVAGVYFGLEKSWHLVVEPLTAFVPFLMVFLLQRSQNRESLAVQLKLNELVAAVQGASNSLIDVEGLSEEELKTIHEHYQGLADLAKKEIDLGKSHSVEEAHQRHSLKLKAQRAS